MSNFDFIVEKGNNAVISDSGIELFGKAQDIFLRSKNSFIFKKEFKLKIKLRKIDEFGGFIIRLFYKYNSHLFKGIYFVHHKDYYEVRIVYNHDDGHWSFIENLGRVDRKEIINTDTEITISSDGLYISLLVNGKFICHINADEFNIYDGEATYFEFDACMGRFTIHEIEYCSDSEYNFYFSKKENNDTKIISLPLDIIVLEKINDDLIEKLVKANIFNKIILKDKPSEKIFDLVKDEKKCIICFSKNDNIFNLLSMAHSSLICIVNKCKDVDVLNKFVLGVLSEINNDDIKNIINYKKINKIIIDNDFAFADRDSLLSLILNKNKNNIFKYGDLVVKLNEAINKNKISINQLKIRI